MLSYKEVSILTEKFAPKVTPYGTNYPEFDNNKFGYSGGHGKFYFTFFRFNDKMFAYAFETNNNTSTDNSFHYSIFTGEDESQYDNGRLWSNQHVAGNTNMLSMFNVLLYITTQFLSEHPEIETINFFGEPNSKSAALYSYIVDKKKDEFKSLGFEYIGKDLSDSPHGELEIHKFKIN